MVTPTKMAAINEIFVFIFLYLKISKFVHNTFKIWPFKEHAD